MKRKEPKLTRNKWHPGMMHQEEALLIEGVHIRRDNYVAPSHLKRMLEFLQDRERKAKQ